MVSDVDVNQRRSLRFAAIKAHIRKMQDSLYDPIHRMQARYDQAIREVEQSRRESRGALRSTPIDRRHALRSRGPVADLPHVLRRAI